MSKYNLTEILNESFDSLAKKLDKQKGIDKDEAAKIAGSIAAKKMLEKVLLLNKKLE